jgi:hypothetical protein
MLISPRRILKPTYKSTDAYHTLNDSVGVVKLIRKRYSETVRALCVDNTAVKHNMQALAFRLLLDNLHQPT